MGTYRPAGWRLRTSRVLALSLGLVCRAVLAEDEDASSLELNDLSIDDLAKIDITSVSKRSEPLSDAAASIYVITHDDIIRSGAVTIPEMLRLAPNLLVQRETSNSYDISTRGFSGNQSAQSFSNKLLVLIDGRSVYSPLYSGVYWDMQNVPPQDIERIEVISGPGATLWGANAFNGVINIITRSAGAAQGGEITIAGGNLGQNASVDYGGKLAPDLNYRVYASGLGWNALENAQGTSAHDGAKMGQGGFRLDWTPTDDLVTLQGDLYRGSEDQNGLPDTFVAGENVTGRWQHHLSDGSVIQFQAYYDQTSRATNDNGAFIVRTFELDLQQSLSLGSWNEIVWGGGERAGVVPQDVVLELTESRLIKDLRAPLEVLARLRMKRFHISIDDFGTGHSSLIQLRDIPFTELKIDRGFVQGAWNNDTKRVIYDASCGLARQLGMDIVAEGVETQEDWLFLCDTGCSLAQGYFIGKPMEASAFPAWRASWKSRLAELGAARTIG